jgi:hypothetical protein
MKYSKTNINCLTQAILQIVILIGLTFIIPVKSKAQVAIFAGGNYCSVRNEVFLENKKPITAYNLGVSFQYYPFKRFENISVLNELSFNQKGYQQDLDKNYSFRFNYLTLPILLNYAPFKCFSVQGGIELSQLISTNIEQGTKTYNDFDTGLVFGLSCFEGRRFSLYSRITYGLLPTLDYYAIDELGNFTGEIHDLKNVCLSVGIKFNIYNEKIYFHK